MLGGKDKLIDVLENDSGTFRLTVWFSPSDIAGYSSWNAQRRAGNQWLPTDRATKDHSPGQGCPPFEQSMPWALVRCALFLFDFCAKTEHARSLKFSTWFRDTLCSALPDRSPWWQLKKWRVPKCRPAVNVSLFMKTFPLQFLIEVKGQHFASGARMPEGKGAFADILGSLLPYKKRQLSWSYYSRVWTSSCTGAKKLYVEIIGLLLIFDQAHQDAPHCPAYILLYICWLISFKCKSVPWPLSTQVQLRFLCWKPSTRSTKWWRRKTCVRWHKKHKTIDYCILRCAKCLQHSEIARTEYLEHPRSFLNEHAHGSIWGTTWRGCNVFRDWQTPEIYRACLNRTILGLYPFFCDEDFG